MKALSIENFANFLSNVFSLEVNRKGLSEAERIIKYLCCFEVFIQVMIIQKKIE